MTTKKSAKKKSENEPHAPHDKTEHQPVSDGETAERMRQATRTVREIKNKPSKTRSLDDVIALLHSHGIRFKDEE